MAFWKQNVTLQIQFMREKKKVMENTFENE